MKLATSLLAFLALSAGVTAAACTASSDGTQGDDDDLTSLTARARKVSFGGYVYVDPGASDDQIIAIAKSQTQSAFGALRTANVGVNTRELHDIDKTTFKKSDVSVVDPAHPTATPKKMTRVAYTYTDDAVVPVPMATRSALSIALLAGDYQSQGKTVMTQCTANDSEANEFASDLWYVFDPSLSGCKTAMSAEQKKIDADKKGLKEGEIPLSETSRLYLPITAKFSAAQTNTAPKFPEYDRLYSGDGVEKGKVVIGMVQGLMADWAAGETPQTYLDDGYDMWFQGLREIWTARAGFKLVNVEPAQDLLSYKVGDATIKFDSFDAVTAFELDGTNPAGVTSANRDAVRKVVADTIVGHWLTFEVPVKVAIGGAAAKPLTIKLQTFFGADGSDNTPHKRGIKTSDVFIYNGHSYIGYGPLDPSNFTESDFPKTYQILVMNGCVSYNYYEKDFFPMKEGGTKNLEIISNGLESWVDESGPAMGRLAGSLIDGKLNDYQGVLKAAQFTGMGYDWGMDALRVVDGELDNKYDATKTKIVVQ